MYISKTDNIITGTTLYQATFGDLTAYGDSHFQAFSNLLAIILG